MDLLRAARDGNLGELKKNIEAGADLEMTDHSLNTPLHLAAGFQSPSKTLCVLALLQAGANVEAKNEDNLTPLHTAAQWGDPKCIQALIDAGSNFHVQSDYGTPLTCAATNGHTELVEKFISLGADINAKDRDDLTPLHLAAGHNHTSTCLVLCKAGADPNENQNYWGITPLHCAAMNEDVKSIQILLQAMANPEIRNHQNLAPIDCTAQEKSRQVFIDHEQKQLEQSCVIATPKIRERARSRL